MNLSEFTMPKIPETGTLLYEAISPRWNFKIFNDMYFSPGYAHAGAILFLIFLLILSFARLRRMYVHWSLKGSVGMVAMGFVLALILEGFLILGGRTFFTEFLGWKNPPKPIVNVLDAGRSKAIDTLGVTDTTANSNSSSTITSEQVMQSFQSLSPEEAKAFKEIICTE